jgi:signal transduction histidine kinase
LGSLSASEGKLKRFAEQLPARLRSEAIEISTSLREAKKRFSDLVEMTGIVGGFDRDQVADRLNLYSELERGKACFKLITESYNITISISRVPKNLPVGPILRGELSAVLINTLLNSIKSVIAAGGSDKMIEIDAVREGHRAMLNVRDTGIGLSSDHFEDVFTPFIADPEGRLYDRLEEKVNPQDAHIFGTGSGLGLSIVRDILHARKGSIRFMKPEAGWSAHLQIVLPT